MKQTPNDMKGTNQPGSPGWQAGQLTGGDVVRMDVARDSQRFRSVVEESRKRMGLDSIKTLAIFLLLITSAHAQEYTDDQIVNAIYLAEGGAKAQYPYGIRSVRCESKAECRAICQRTVRNNRKRYLKHDGIRSRSFITFLGARYCPTQGAALSNREKSVNKNWLKNVKYFLTKGA